MTQKAGQSQFYYTNKTTGDCSPLFYSNSFIEVIKSETGKLPKWTQFWLNFQNDIELV